MHDAGTMRALERVGNLTPDLHHVRDGQRPLTQAIGKGFALDEFHDEVVGTVVVVPNIVQCADVRMTELRDGACLAFEACLQVWTSHQRRFQSLDGDRAIKPCIAGAIHLAHAAGANWRDDFIGTQSGSRIQSHFSPLKKALYFSVNGPIHQGSYD